VNERARALELLRRIEEQSLFATPLLQNEPPFVRALVLGVLRWRSRLDFIARSFAARAIDPEVLDVLRVGIYQLLEMDVAGYAAVSETVDLAPKRAKGFVNAVLRKVTRGPLPEARDLATRTAHPEWLIERWTRIFGAERTARIAEANQQLSYPDVVALEDAVPPESEPSRLVDGVYKLRGSSASLDRGAFWPMDEGSAVIAAIAANAGKEILDLAAAPGSKTLYMSRRGGARVVSNDLSLSRLMPLIRGASRREEDRRIVVSDARRPPFGRGFDVVLLDAPCSATGTIRKNPELKWRLQEKDLASFAALQKEMLAAALQLARRFVVYSTCSLEPEENDAVVAACGARLADASAFVPPGAGSWVENRVLRLTPESGADGFTAFVLEA
jgi:16S rRNA (cytosine967-C5)-methyltransferase